LNSFAETSGNHLPGVSFYTNVKHPMSMTTSKRARAWNPLRFPEWLRLHFSDNQRYFIIWVIAGLACGLTAVLYHEAIVILFRWVRGLSRVVGGNATYAVLIAAPVIGGLISGIICSKIEPTAGGGGITQVKARFFLHFGVFRLREAFWRFVASAINVGSGMAMGPEGPTIHMCSAVASWIGQVFGLAKQRIQAMVPIGAAAGLSAAFNTPMAGMFFVFEELIGELSSRSIFGILIAVVLSAIVERTMLGEHALFTLGLPDFTTSWWMLLCIPIGIACAFIGTAFVKIILHLRVKAREQHKVPNWIRPAISGLFVGLIGVLILHLTGRDGVFSIGYGDLSDTLNGNILVPSVLILLLVGKFFAYISASAGNTSGGIFAPVLFIGGMAGALIGVSGLSLGLYDSHDIVGALALVGMGSMFASVIRCPLTSFMIVFELTHNYTIMLPLMTGNIIAYVLSVSWHPLSLYDSMLVQDKITLKRMPAYQGEQDWHNLPVKAIMTFDVITVRGDRSAAENLARIDETTRVHHAYPVIDSGGELRGMVTHGELEHMARQEGNPPLLQLIGHRRVVAISSETSIHDVARILVTEDVLQAPVVTPTEDKRMLGIVTLHDIARQQNAIEESLGH
jgi:CIC family chloride channel protein